MNKNVKLIDHNSLIASTVNESYRKKFDFYETTRVKLTKNYFKFKWIFFCVFLIVLYVSLNNYLIIFIYMKPVHSVTSDTSDVNNKYSFLHYLFNRKPLEVLKQEIKTPPTSNNSHIHISIDSQDIEIGNFKSLLINNHLKLLDESYFKETPVNAKSQCLLPKLNPYDRSIMQFVKKQAFLKCNPKKNWIYIENGFIRISKSAISKHGTILCAYIPLYRGHNDFTVFEGNRIFPIMDNFPLITDFFKIDCRSKDGGIYSNIHSGIAYESTLHIRHKWNPLPKQALGYNVLMFGFDSVSRMSWIRMMPKSYEYMIKEGFIVLKGYNIVGDGTPQALLPILTGKKETELPESRRGFANASYVDVFPWIWDQFKKAGYVTQWAEDMQSIGTFQLRMLGFKKPPVDHYMRVFYLEAERYYNRFRRLCLGSISRHKNIINWVKEFFLIYDKKPKFSFIFHSEASHNYNNPLSLIDDDLLEFLTFLKESGIMKTTVLLFMSDHGVRVSDLRQYSQGKLEERLPFFSIRMPESFQEKHPDALRNLRLNSRKLTTPFDIHETLKSILEFVPERTQTRVMPRGISLFKHIPVNRSCKDAHIEAHWCSCLNWIDINTAPKTTEPEMNEKIGLINNQAIQSGLKSEEVYSKFANRIAHKALEFINSLIDKEYKKYCEKLIVQSIERLSRLNLNQQLLAFKKSKDIHGREALFESNPKVTSSIIESIFEKDFFLKPSNYSEVNSTNSGTGKHPLMDMFVNSEINFQIVLTTSPNNASYELSFKYNVYEGVFLFNRNEISRINSYNSSANCMLDKRPDLRQFCYCK